ncbi:MAG: hypothetical protein V1793_04245 [Pseudomonadota bacterium]
MELGASKILKTGISDTGPFKEFGFADDDERREFAIAVWLHNCGKILAPVRVISLSDVFEALCARDRHNKQMMTVSQALEIMARTRDAKGPDPDLFKPFQQNSSEIRQVVSETGTDHGLTLLFPSGACIAIKCGFEPFVYLSPEHHLHQGQPVLVRICLVQGPVQFLLQAFHVFPEVWVVKLVNSTIDDTPPFMFKLVLVILKQS